MSVLAAEELYNKGWSLMSHPTKNCGAKSCSINCFTKGCTAKSSSNCCTTESRSTSDSAEGRTTKRLSNSSAHRSAESDPGCFPTGSSTKDSSYLHVQKEINFTYEIYLKRNVKLIEFFLLIIDN